MAAGTKEQVWAAVGRRKESSARVRLKIGTGAIVINERAVDHYFPRESLRMMLNQPLTLTDQVGKVDVLVSVQGGGLSGQAGAVRLGIARALLDMDAELRPVLKKAGFLTRDAREVERKKYGRAGARKRFQYGKR